MQGKEPTHNRQAMRNEYFYNVKRQNLKTNTNIIKNFVIEYVIHN